MIKNLVIVVAGANSLHNIYKDSDNYVLKVIDYRETPGTKYPLIYNYLVNDLFAQEKQYENYLFLDDDIMLITEDIDKIFNEMDKGNWQVGTPSFNAQNMPHNTMQTDNNCVGHTTNAMDICSVFMKHDYLLQVFESFKLNKSGYGLQNYWYSKTEVEFFVLDTVQAMHTKPSNYGKDSIYNLTDGEEGAYNEYLEMWVLIEKEFGKKKEDHIAKFIKKYLKNVISFPIIYCDSDKGNLINCIKSLPQDSQIIIAETIPYNGGWRIDIKDEKADGSFIVAEIHYPMYDKNGNEKNLFNFANARNLVKSLATRPVIFSIDADELLLNRQHELIKQEALELANQNEYNYVNITNSSTCKYGIDKDKTQPIFEMVEQSRIFKNKPSINWVFPNQEQITEFIDGKHQPRNVKKSIIKIDHTGYEIDKEHLLRKFERNFKMYLDNISENGYEDYEHAKHYLHREANNYYKLKEQMKDE